MYVWHFARGLPKVDAEIAENSRFRMEKAQGDNPAAVEGRGFSLPERSVEATLITVPSCALLSDTSNPKKGVRIVPVDIREANVVGPQDILRLNFVRTRPPYVFRRYFRQGLRSHIFEVLLPEAWRAETEGLVQEGVLRFPRARPVKMFRVFRTRFHTREEGLREIRRVKLVERYLSPESLAFSEEFLADGRVGPDRFLVLCGLQEYVDGEPLDPWALTGEEGSGRPDRTGRFVERVKRMIRETGHIPDLAGMNNLILTPEGHVKLVDINNISRVSFSPEIPLDDKRYPICDKSVQALALLERRLTGRGPDRGEPLYAHFLNPERVRRVRIVEEDFHRESRPSRRLDSRRASDPAR